MLTNVSFFCRVPFLQVPDPEPDPCVRFDPGALRPAQKGAQRDSAGDVHAKPSFVRNRELGVARPPHMQVIPVDHRGYVEHTRNV
jgi:hypothetical protein